MSKISARNRVFLSIDCKRKKVVIQPSHCGLDIAMHHCEFRVRPNEYRAPNGGSNVAKCYVNSPNDAGLVMPTPHFSWGDRLLHR